MTEARVQPRSRRATPEAALQRPRLASRSREEAGLGVEAAEQPEAAVLVLE
jgi:hypothetical protein